MRTALLLFTLMALPLAAQETRFWPMWNPSIMKDLSLSDMQTQEIKAVIREFRPRLIDLKAAMEKTEAGVEDAFNEDPFDTRRATDAYEKVITSRSELARVFCQMNTRLRAILNADQWRSLQKLSAQAKAAGSKNSTGAQ